MLLYRLLLPSLSYDRMIYNTIHDMNMMMDRIILEFAQDTYQDTYQDTSIKILLLQLFITKLPLYTLTAVDIHFSPLLHIAIPLLISS